MVFNSFHFVLFFPIVALIYYSLPHKLRHIWLLAASYYFYMCWNATYAILITITIVVTYFCGILISKAESEKAKKGYVASTFIINLGILVFFKYFNFIGESINRLLSMGNIAFKIPALDILLPVGISFYTFQSLGYVVDVYRKDVHPQKNLLKYALFVSFFPTLLSGPIERSYNLMPQFDEPRNFDYNRAREGFIMLLWGYFKKVVIADRLAPYVDHIYNNLGDVGTAAIIIATIFFTVQIYCDFSGYSDIAIGTAKIMGFNLIKNFDLPYTSKSIAEFWRRWHISLSTWFRDYLYIPLGGNRVSRKRWIFNIMLVFIVSGIWHGANWTFLLWGLLHGIYQVIGKISRKPKDKLLSKLKISKNAWYYKVSARFITFCSVAIAWVFFKANTVQDAFYIFKEVIKAIPRIAQTNMPRLFLGRSIYFYDFVIGAVLIIILLFGERRIESFLKKLPYRILPIRWFAYLFIIFFIILLGIYGSLSPASFIYLQF
ncbi:MAG: MBOAT family protein [Christensenellaceae bacterium]|nr:MBOAT family protein [Christensenellaceae bacterium]